MDTAPPFTENQIAHLFDRNAELREPADPEAVSSELGLVVARALLVLQGGGLACWATAEGNHYRLTLPLYVMKDARPEKVQKNPDMA